MSRLRKAFALSASDCLFIAQAWKWLGLVEIGLTCLPLGKLVRIIHPQRPENLHRDGKRELPHAVAERMAFCVELAARMYLLDATCLKKAMALCALLTRRGFDAQVMIGAARATEGRLDAHAWVECQGKVLLGEAQAGRYTVLCGLPGSRLEAAPPEPQAIR